MGLLDIFRKQADVKRPRFWGGGLWSSPPEKDVRGLLQAYGNIYSLFGVALRIATACSEARWRLYKGNDRSERNQIAEHPILTLLDFANEFQTGQEIVELMQLHLDIAGKAYWYLPPNQLGVPGEVWVMPPHQMKIVPSEKEFIKGYIYSCGGEQIPLDKKRVIRFAMPDPLNPYGSIGYAQAAAVELDSEDYAGQWNRNFFYNSARPDGALIYPEALTDEQFERLSQQWQQKYGGLTRAHKVAILEGGVDYKQIQMSQKDMDFQALRKMTRENLLFTFGMPLSVMGISENVNRANAEAGDYTFARWLIKPRLTRIRNKLNEQLLPMFPAAKGVELDFDEIVPETLEMKQGLAESGVKAGWMTVNEARQLNGYDLVPKGDVFLIPFNLAPVPAQRLQEPPPEKPEAPKSKLLFTLEWQKEAYWKVYIAKTGAYERTLITRLRDMFSKQSKDALAKLRAGSKVLLDKEKAKKQFTEAVTAPLKDLVLHSLEDADALINPEPAHRSKQTPEEAAIAWLETRIGWAADEVGDKTADMLSKTLAEGYAEGESIGKLSNRVRDVFDDCSRRRAKMIARTETITAANEGALKGYEGTGIIEKVEFYAAMDERTCEDCMDLHTQEFKLADSHGVIPVHPDCRCVWLPIA